MYLNAQTVEWPVPTTLGIAAVLVVALGLVVLAIAAEMRRKSALARSGRAAQWAAVDRIVEERRLNADESSMLRDLLTRYAQNEPLAALSSNVAFGRVVDTAMENWSARLSPEEFRQRGGRLRDIRIQLGLDGLVPGQQIHSTRELDGGQQVEVALEGTDHWINLHVNDVDEACLYLQYRGEDTITELPGAGQRVKCGLWRDDDARYTFMTEVLASELSPPRLTLAHTRDLKRTQTRGHFRVRHDQSTMVGILGASVKEESAELERQQPVTRLRARITSLSAGGCALVVQEAVSRRTVLRIALDLPGEKPLEIHARIVGTTPISGGRQLLRVKFIGLSDEAADVVSRHVMRRQQQTLAARMQRGTV